MLKIRQINDLGRLPINTPNKPLYNRLLIGILSIKIKVKNKNMIKPNFCHEIFKRGENINVR
jgi:hypothetical protein